MEVCSMTRKRARFRVPQTPAWRTLVSIEGDERLRRGRARPPPEGSPVTEVPDGITPGRALLAETRRRLIGESQPRIHKCLAQLTEEEIWHRPECQPNIGVRAHRLQRWQQRWGRKSRRGATSPEQDLPRSWVPTPGVTKAPLKIGKEPPHE